MHIFRYFMFVGGALLALLFAADLVWPAPPVAQAVATAAYDQPLIRIRSDRHLPDRVVLDTTQPAIATPVVTMAAVAAQPDKLDEMSAKSRVRDTFARFTPAGPKADASSAKKADAKPELQAQLSQVHAPAQPRRKVAKTHPVPPRGQPMMLVAQQPHFGLFNMTW